MAADEAAKSLMQTLCFLHVKRQGRKTLGQRFTLGMQGFNAVFTRGAAKQRQRREARITPLAVGNLHHHRFFQLVHAEYAIVKGLRIAFDQIEIFRTILQPFKLLGNLRQIRHHDGMARRTVQRGEVRRIVKANIIVDLGQQNAAEPFRQRVEARIFRTARLAETLDFFVDGALAGADLVTFNDSFALALQQLLQVFGNLLAGLKLLAALLAQLVKAVLRRQPDRRPAHQRLSARLQLLQLLAQGHALFLSVRNAVGQRSDARFQLLMQRFQIVDIVAFALAFAELSQLALGVLLLAQALLQLVEAAAQPLRLLGLVALVHAVAQQFARHVPGFIARQRAVNRRHQLVGLFKLAVRGLRHAHFLFQRQHFLRRFLLFRLEGFQPLVGALRRQVRQMAQRLRALQRLQRLVILNGAGLLHVERLLIVGELVFQLIHFQLGGLGAGFVLFLAIDGFRHHFVLLFQTDLQLVEIRFVALDFFLLTQRSLHQVQVIAGGLVIGFQIALRAVMLLQFARHVDVLILLSRQLRTRGEEIAAILQRLIQVNAPLVGVTHIVRRHVVGGFADQVFEQIAIGLGDADRLESHAVFPQRRFHILECLTHAAVFRQQVVAQRAGNGAGDPAVQRGLNQAVVLATIGGGTQATRHHAQIEH